MDRIQSMHECETKQKIDNNKERSHNMLKLIVEDDKELSLKWRT